MNEILEKQIDGGLPLEGKVVEVALEIVSNPSELNDLAKGLGSENEVIRGRAYKAI